MPPMTDPRACRLRVHVTYDPFSFSSAYLVELVKMLP
jgi:hypothetical protein